MSLLYKYPLLLMKQKFFQERDFARFVQMENSVVKVKNKGLKSSA